MANISQLEHIVNFAHVRHISFRDSTEAKGISPFTQSFIEGGGQSKDCPIPNIGLQSEAQSLRITVGLF